MTTKLSLNELLERAKSERIAIHTPTEKQAITLLSELVKRGFKWASGTKLSTETWYGIYKENTCYNFEPNKKITYSPLSFYRAINYSIIEFSEIDFKENA